MKKIVALAAVSIVFIMALTSCSKTDDTVPASGMGAVTGVHTFFVAPPLFTAVRTSGNLYLAASDTANKRSIYITVNNFTGNTGTVNVDNNFVTAIYDSSATHTTHGYTGTVTFTSVSPQLVGTFNFNCLDSTKVKTGTFSIVAPVVQ